MLIGMNSIGGKVTKCVAMGTLVAAIGLIGCAPKKSSPRAKAPTSSSFKALAKLAGFELDESAESAKFEAIAASTDVNKKGAADGFTLVFTTKLDGAKLAELGLKGKDPKGATIQGVAKVAGGAAGKAEIDKAVTDLVYDNAGKVEPAVVEASLACDGSCGITGVFLVVKYKGKDDKGKEKDVVLKAGLGIDFKGAETGKATAKAQAFMKAK